MLIEEISPALVSTSTALGVSAGSHQRHMIWVHLADPSTNIRLQKPQQPFSENSVLCVQVGAVPWTRGRQIKFDAFAFPNCLVRRSFDPQIWGLPRINGMAPICHLRHGRGAWRVEPGALCILQHIAGRLKRTAPQQSSSEKMDPPPPHIPRITWIAPTRGPFGRGMRQACEREGTQMTPRGTWRS